MNPAAVIRRRGGERLGVEDGELQQRGQVRAMSVVTSICTSPSNVATVV
ncbi:hypothetical protein [Gordonia effusa]|nr:hypothetical protein [Gordonia effusa]